MKLLIAKMLAVATLAVVTGGADALPAMEKSAVEVTAGRVLLGELNCTACHAASESQAKWLTPKAAPRLAEISGRASPEWLVQYLASPQQTMPGTTMPECLGSIPAAERLAAAESLTHYLLSQKASAFKRILPDRAAVARGEALYHRVGCVACHAPRTPDTETMPSVPLPNMTAKWSVDGLRRFLIDPLASRPSGRMPAMKLTDAEAADIAHYLLRETRVPAALQLSAYRGSFRALDDIDSAELIRTGPVDGFTVDAARRDRSAALQYTGWLRIDQPGDYTFYFTANGASRLSIDGGWVAGEDSWKPESVDAKVVKRLKAGWLAIRVDYIHRGSKPPAMKLEWEGSDVPREAIAASRLRSEREAAPMPTVFVVDATKTADGQRLYAKLNCAACHEGKTTANPARPMTALNDARGCLADSPQAGTPDFQLTPSKRNDLRTAIRSLNTAHLTAPSPSERVAHTLATFNCTACHGRDGVGGVTAQRDRYFTSSGEDLGEEGRLPPSLQGVGNKLQPVWLNHVLTQGAIVRPYLNTRMPQFGSGNVGHLPELLIAIDRKPGKIPASVDDPVVQREAGRKIVGTDGLSCIVCHRFNHQPAQTMQVVDLTTGAERLNEDWFRRFLLDPNRFHPGTRMPAYWPEGKSAIPAILNADTDRQHAALWTYLADGPRAKFPVGLSRQNVELVVGGEAIVYRGKLWEAGFRAVALGYPGQLNAAFDAEDMRLSLLWRGRFLDAGPHWQSQGMGQIRPLGTDVIVFPHGSPLARLIDPTTPWPTETAKALGMKFHGYQLDPLKRPTLLYSFGKVNVEDFLIPAEINGKMGFRRTVTFTELPSDGLYFRLATGKLTASGENSWRLNDAITIKINGPCKPFARGSDDKQELIVSIPFAAKSHQMEVEYVW